MADNIIFLCKHMAGDGYCILHEAYCHEGPCGESEPIEYAPVKHGRWEHMGNDLFDLWKCTVCGEEWTFEYDPTSTDTKVNYCPECGSKMDEEG